MSKTLYDYISLTGMSLQELQNLLKSYHLDAPTASVPVSDQAEELLRRYVRFPDALTGYQKAVGDPDSLHVSVNPDGSPPETHSADPEPPPPPSPEESATEKLLLWASAIPVSSEMLLKRAFVPFLKKFRAFSFRNALLCMIVSSSALTALSETAEDAILSGEPSRYDFIGETLRLLRLIYDDGRLLVQSDRKHGEVRTLTDWIEKQLVLQRITVLSCNLVLNAGLKKLFQERHVLIYIMNLTGQGCFKETRLDTPVFESEAQLNFPERNYSGNSGKIPHLGEIVCTESGRRVHLETQLGSAGAEGTVFAVNAVECVKIFHAYIDIPMKIKKIRTLCSHAELLNEKNPVLTRRMAFPQEIVMNFRGEPVGYLMRRFSGITPLSGIQPGELPGFSRRKQIAMAVSLAEMTAFAHQNHMLLCDVLSHANLCFDDRQNAYFLDMDSIAFITGKTLYSSGTGRDEMLSPEHIGRNEGNFFHKSSDDVWAFQTLLFYLLMFASPYSRKECGTLAEDVRNGMYPYQGADGTADASALQKLSRSVSHLPGFLRDDFRESFHFQGKYFPEQYRLNIQHWLNDCLQYQAILPEMMKKDMQSGMAFPEQFRQAGSGY